MGRVATRRRRLGSGPSEVKRGQMSKQLARVEQRIQMLRDMRARAKTSDYTELLTKQIQTLEQLQDNIVHHMPATGKRDYRTMNTGIDTHSSKRMK